jgi:hypothetical protein
MLTFTELGQETCLLLEALPGWALGVPGSLVLLARRRRMTPGRLVMIVEIISSFQYGPALPLGGIFYGIGDSTVLSKLIEKSRMDKTLAISTAACVAKGLIIDEIEGYAAKPRGIAEQQNWYIGISLAEPHEGNIEPISSIFPADRYDQKAMEMGKLLLKPSAWYYS